GSRPHHSAIVSCDAVLLARRLGLAGQPVELNRRAALLHEVGKVALRDGLLLEPARLAEGERGEMERHPTVGAEMVARLPEYRRHAPPIRLHHAARDGSGYPGGPAGAGIPLGARIMAIADAHDAMSTPGACQPGLPPDAIVGQFRHGRGRRWDPTLV